MVKRTIQTVLVCTFGLLAFCTAGAGQAHAATIDYDLSGIFGLQFASTDGSDRFLLAFGYGAGGPAADYTFRLDTATGEGWLFGELTGAVTASNDPNAALSDDPVTASINLHYTGLTVGTDPVTGQDVIAIGRGDADGSGTINLNSEFLGGAVTLMFDLEDKFAFPAGGAAGNPTYGDLGIQPFNLFAGILPTGGGEVYKSWVMAQNTVNLFPRDYNVGGDFHANITGSSEIPEPATAALLGMGMIGGLLRRRKKA